LLIDPQMKLFGVMAYFLIIMGSLTGGIIAMLLPKFCVGAVAGFNLCLLAETVSMEIQYSLLSLICIMTEGIDR